MQLSKAIQGFVYTITGDGYSPHTVEYYTRFLNQLRKSIGDIEISAVPCESVRDFLMGLHERELSGQTVRMYWRVFRVFFKWAQESNLITDNPTATISQPKAATLEIVPFTPDEIKALLKSAGSRRNQALILLLLDTGVRVGEMSRMMCKDLNMSTGAIQINPYMSGVKSKSRIVYLGQRTKKALWLYLAERGELQPTDPLIATLQGEPLNRYSVKCLLARIAGKADIKGVHAHRFRHSFAITYLMSGGDAFTLQALLGHSSLTMVKHYLHIASMDLAAAHRRSSPVDNLKL